MWSSRENQEGESSTASAPIQDTFLPTGTTATIRCETIVALETIVWYKNQEEIRESSDHFLVESSADRQLHSLTIIDAKVSDTAEYGVIIDGTKNAVTRLFVTAPLGIVDETIVEVSEYDEESALVLQEIEKTVDGIQSTLCDRSFTHLPYAATAEATIVSFLREIVVLDFVVRAEITSLAVTFDEEHFDTEVHDANFFLHAPYKPQIEDITAVILEYGFVDQKFETEIFLEAKSEVDFTYEIHKDDKMQSVQRIEAVVLIYGYEAEAPIEFTIQAAQEIITTKEIKVYDDKLQSVMETSKDEEFVMFGEQEAAGATVRTHGIIQQTASIDLPEYQITDAHSSLSAVFEVEEVSESSMKEVEIPQQAEVTTDLEILEHRQQIEITEVVIEEISIEKLGQYVGEIGSEKQQLDVELLTLAEEESTSSHLLIYGECSERASLQIREETVVVESDWVTFAEKEVAEASVAVEQAQTVTDSVADIGREEEFIMVAESGTSEITLTTAPAPQAMTDSLIATLEETALTALAENLTAEAVVMAGQKVAAADRLSASTTEFAIEDMASRIEITEAIVVESQLESPELKLSDQKSSTELVIESSAQRIDITEAVVIESPSEQEHLFLSQAGTEHVLSEVELMTMPDQQGTQVTAVTRGMQRESAEHAAKFAEELVASLVELAVLEESEQAEATTQVVSQQTESTQYETKFLEEQISGAADLLVQEQMEAALAEIAVQPEQLTDAITLSDQVAKTDISIEGSSSRVESTQATVIEVQMEEERTFVGEIGQELVTKEIELMTLPDEEKTEATVTESGYEKEMVESRTSFSEEMTSSKVGLFVEEIIAMAEEAAQENSTEALIELLCIDENEAVRADVLAYGVVKKLIEATITFSAMLPQDDQVTIAENVVVEIRQPEKHEEYVHQIALSKRVRITTFISFLPDDGRRTMIEEITETFHFDKEAQNEMIASQISEASLDELQASIISLPAEEDQQEFEMEVTSEEQLEQLMTHMHELQHIKKLKKTSSRQSQDEPETITVETVTTELLVTVGKEESVGHSQLTIVTSESSTTIEGIEDSASRPVQKLESEIQRSEEVVEVSIATVSEATTISESSSSLDAPVFVQQLAQDLRAETTRSIQLKCNVKGRPMPAVQWKHNETVVEENDNISMIYEDGICILQITKASASSEGIYTCTATNEIGQAITSCNLHITEEKEVTQEEQSTQVDVVLEKQPNEDRLDATILSVEAESTQQLVLPEGSEMTDVQVELMTIDESDTISATLFAFGEERESNEIAVRLDSEAKIETELIAMSEIDQSSTTVPTAQLQKESLETQATTEEALTSSQVELVTLAEEEASSIAVTTRHTVVEEWLGTESKEVNVMLEVDIAMQQQADVLEAELVGEDLEQARAFVAPHGQSSTTADIQVDKEAAVDQLQISVAIQPHETAAFDEQQTECEFDVISSWIREETSSILQSTPVVAQESHQVGAESSTETSLEQILAQLEETGSTDATVMTDSLTESTGSTVIWRPEIKIELVTDAEESESDTSLSMGPPMEGPLFLQDLSRVVTHEGEDIQLKCIVKGWPTPVIRWSCNDHAIEQQNNEKIETIYDDGICLLRLKNVSKSQAGAYRCTATNNVGRTMTSCRVYIGEAMIEDMEAPVISITEASESESIGLPLQKPEFVRVLQNKTIVEGDAIQMRATVKGFPTPTVNWYHNGEKIEETAETQMIYEDGICVLQIAFATTEFSDSARCSRSQAALRCFSA
uniref:Ig-like domain-containing protein n=1 Tax=Plectus sambesii TaxID=2011161 RepID=A0A914WN01_9BILA